MTGRGSGQADGKMAGLCAGLCRDALVPFLGIAEFRVYVIDHATEAEQAMSHLLADGEFRMQFAAGYLHLEAPIFLSSRSRVQLSTKMPPWGQILI